MDNHNDTSSRNTQSGIRSISRLSLIFLLGTALLLVVTSLASTFMNTPTPIERLDYASRDLAMRLRGPRQPSGDIVIVAVDDFSLNWTGLHWPWPRAYIAQIVDYLNQAGARMVGLDVLLFEPGADPGGDAKLAAAFKESNASVSVMQYFKSVQMEGNVRLESETAKTPLPIYREALTGFGTTAISSDADAITRGMLAYQRTQDGTIYYNWAFELARLYLNASPPSDPTPEGLTFNGQRVPLDAGRLLVNFAGPSGTYPTYSAARVVLGDYSPEIFRDKIVLIGITSDTIPDNYATPFSAQVRTPGVEIVANAADTLINQRYLRVAPPWVNLLLIALATMLAAVFIRSTQPGLTIGLMTAAMLVFAAIYYLVYRGLGYYLPFIAPEAMLFLGTVLPTLEQAVSQEIEKRRVRGLFTRFISPEMVDQLIATQDINSLNKRTNLTVLFSDIRGFTTLSEKLSPEQVVGLLNPYLEAMTAIIYKHGGTVDKYEGDAIMAFFGEPVAHPDHAQRAVRTAIEMLQTLADLNARWAQEGRLSEHFEIGIGINSGEVFVGLLGSEQRVSYTIIGDNVNLAARIQDLTKVYSWPIIISENTYQLIQDEFEVEFIERTLVRGKTESVNIYKILGPKGASASELIQILHKE